MFEAGDWVVVTIKRSDYYGLEGVVANSGQYPNVFPFTRHYGFITYIAVELDSHDLPERLAQMSKTAAWSHPSLYWFTESQIERLGSRDDYAISILGEDYFA